MAKSYSTFSDMAASNFASISGPTKSTKTSGPDDGLRGGSSKAATSKGIMSFSGGGDDGGGSKTTTKQVVSQQQINPEAVKQGTRVIGSGLGSRPSAPQTEILAAGDPRLDASGFNDMWFSNIENETDRISTQREQEEAATETARLSVLNDRDFPVDPRTNIPVAALMPRDSLTLPRGPAPITTGLDVVQALVGQTEQAIPTLPSSMGITAPTQYVPANIDFTQGAEPISAPEISRVEDATFDRYTRTTSAGSRELEDIEGVVLHYTHGSPRGSSVETFMDVGFNRGRGAPFFIDRDGTIHEVGDWRNSIIQHTSRASGIGTYRAPSGERFSSTNTVGIEIDVGWDWANDRPLEGAAGQPTEAQLNSIRYLTNNVIDEVNAVRPDDLQLDINRSVYAHPELGRKKPTEGTYALQWLREQEGLPATRDVEWYMDNRGQERIRINRSLVPRPRPTGEGSSKQTTEKGEAGKQTTAKDAGSGDAFVVSAIDQVLRNEGGYQRNRGDRGNYRPDGTLVGTNRGITALALAQYRGVDANSITAQDIQGVTEEEARAIYRQNYYERPRIDELPANIRENVFDMYVNSYTNSIKILQRLVGVEEDGYIGTDTLNALEEANITNDDYSDAREAYYRAIVENDPTQRENLRGWINRANKYRD